MKVKMKVYISGTRNGEPWPAAGGEIDLPASEAAKYCANGLAIPVSDDGDYVEERAGEYADLGVPELQAQVDSRNLDVEGTGKDGYVLKADLVAALEADDG